MDGREAVSGGATDELMARIDSVQHWKAAVEALLDPFLLLGAMRDADRRVVDFEYLDANDAAAAFIGRSRAELIGSTLLSVSPDANGEQLVALCQRVVDTGEPLTMDGAAVRHPAFPGPTYLDLRAVRSGDGVVLTYRDVTQRVVAAENLAASEMRFRLLAEHASDVVFTSDLDQRVTWIAPTVTRALGYDPSELLGTRMADLCRPEVRTATALDIDEVYAGREPLQASGYLFELRTKSGDYRWMSGNAHPLTDPDGTPVGVVAGMRDVTDLIAAKEALVEVATHDDLTGLLTRGEILQRLAATLSHPPRSGGRVAVAFCDLDDLKTINDRYGHGAGDEALRVTATRVRATVREGDLVSRFGGDEILVTLDCVHDYQDARTIAEKIRKAALLPIPILGGTFDVTLSIGITLAEPGDTIDSIIARADNAMYEAKATGKNQVVIVTRHTD